MRNLLQMSLIVAMIAIVLFSMKTNKTTYDTAENEQVQQQADEQKFAFVSGCITGFIIMATVCRTTQRIGEHYDEFG